MKKYRVSPKIVIVTFCLVLSAFAGSASALTIGDEHELGTISHSIPQGDQDLTAYMASLVALGLGGTSHVIIGTHDNLITRSQNDFGVLPAPPNLMLRGTGSLINVGDASYLLAHYGGSGGGFSEVWFLHNFKLVNIPTTADGHSLSGWALFGPAQPIPDGGATLGLLSSGLAALGVLRRFSRSRQ